MEEVEKLEIRRLPLGQQNRKFPTKGLNHLIPLDTPPLTFSSRHFLREL